MAVCRTAYGTWVLAGLRLYAEPCNDAAFQHPSVLDSWTSLRPGGCTRERHLAPSTATTHSQASVNHAIAPIYPTKVTSANRVGVLNGLCLLNPKNEFAFRRCSNNPPLSTPTYAVEKSDDRGGHEREQVAEHQRVGERVGVESDRTLQWVVPAHRDAFAA